MYFCRGIIGKQYMNNPTHYPTPSILDVTVVCGVYEKKQT